jgi:hypothetical protein
MEADPRHVTLASGAAERGRRADAPIVRIDSPWRCVNLASLIASARDAIPATSGGGAFGTVMRRDPRTTIPAGWSSAWER